MAIIVVPRLEGNEHPRKYMDSILLFWKSNKTLLEMRYEQFIIIPVAGRKREIQLPAFVTDAQGTSD